METYLNSAKCNSSLDDSLTNIQWLYRLDTPDNLLGHNTITLNKNIKTKGKDKMAEGSDKKEKEAEDSPKNPHSKPPYSYSTLILLAINSSREKKMTLQEIYKWIEDNFPYFKKCKKAWKNSIRHNLSLHSFFIKELRPSSLPGKGNFWCLSSEGKNNIVKEVMKHSQPLLQIPYKIQTSAMSSAGGLRPILPKPSTDNSPSLSAGGIMGNIGILANGVQYSLPVMFVSNPGIVKPNNNAGSSTTEGEIKLHFTSKDAEGVNLPTNKMKEEEKCSLNTPLLVEKTSQENIVPTVLAKTESDRAFPLEFGMGTKRYQDKARSNIENMLALKRCHFSSKTNELMSSPKKPKQLEHKYPPESAQVVCIQRTPLRNNAQPTLSAINSQASSDCSSAAAGSQFFEGFGGMTSSPVNLSSTPGKDRGSLNTPNWLSPLGPSCIGLNTKTGFTPLKYDSDSGFFTPAKDEDFDFNFLLSPTQTAVKPSPRTKKNKEGCRKSLHLGTIKEDYSEGESLLDWLQI